MLRVKQTTTPRSIARTNTFSRRVLRLPRAGLALLLMLSTGWIWTSAVAASDSGELSPTTEDALLAALDDERHAQATYRAVIARHGEVMPFARIVEAEGRHEGHLLALFETYGLEAPADAWGEREIEVPDTVVEACREAIESEKTNVALYEELLASEAIPQADIRELFGHLRDMSEDHHLAAFTRCAERGGERGGAAAGPGMGRGKGFCGGMGKGKGPGQARARAGCGGGCGVGGGEGEGGAGCACGMCRRGADAP